MTNNAPNPISGHPSIPASNTVGPPPPDPSARSPYEPSPQDTPTLDRPPISLPPLHPPRHPRPPRHRPNLYRPLLLAALVGVVFATATPGSPLRSVGWAIALSILIGALTTTSARRPAAVSLGLGGAAFVPWLGVRMSPWLTSINLLAAGGLVLASLGLPAAGSLRVTVAHHLLRIIRSVGGLVSGPAHFSHNARRTASGTRVGGVRRLVPSVLVGLTTLVVGLAILASGDALLASFFDVGGIVGTGAVRVATGLTGIAAFAVLIGATHVPGSSDAAPRSRPTPVLPTLFGFGGLSIAIGAYAATQISVAVLGADFVRSRTGLTYAEYARGGFFQMVVVSLVSVAAIGVARGVVRATPEAARPIRIGASFLTIGVVVTVVSAIVKLGVYADTFGLTMLRVYTVVFACWLGLLAILSFVTLLRRSATWFAPALLGSMCVGAFAMNIADPEQIVAKHNLDRAEQTGKLDVGYLASLSLDAAPVVFDRLDSIDAVYDDRSRDSDGTTEAQQLMREVWCAKVIDATASLDRPEPLKNGAFAFNLSRGDALDAAGDACR